MINNSQDTPKVSVIMPAHNEEKGIRDAIQSILNQTYSNLELIVVDDCSTDKTAAIVRSINDDRIIFLQNEVNIGVTKARNRALEAASGDLIACLDADDTCEPNRLQVQVAYMVEHSNCIACGTYADCNHGDSITIQGNECHGDVKAYLTKNNAIVQSSVMYRSHINGQKVFYPDVNPFEDYALWIELSKVGDLHIIPEILVHRVDLNNMANKSTWAGFNKNGIYKLLLKFQWKATKATGHWVKGLAVMIPTVGKIVITSFFSK